MYGHQHAKYPDPRPARLNDQDRAQWIDNNEGLYLWWKGSRLSKRAFIRQNRNELTTCINNAMGR